MQNEPNPFLCHPEVLEAEILEHVYSQCDIVKYEDSIVFNSVSRHDDVYKDMMTSFIDRSVEAICRDAILPR